MFKLKNKQNDNVLISITLILLIISSFVIVWFSGRNKHEANLTQTPKIIGKSYLTIDFSNGQKRFFEGDIVNNETLVDVLIQASRAGNFSYKLDGKNNLAAVEKFIVNGKKSWHWYLNGKKIDKQLNEIIIKAEDRILIKYE